MKPINDNELAIAEKVDRKARAVRDGVGAWDNQIIGEMRASMPFELTPSDEQFLENYVAWRLLQERRQASLR
jgi:hypothetical protein